MADKEQRFRSEQLEEALAKQDAAAVAFALRNDIVIVPRLVTGKKDMQVRVFGREGSDRRILLLFSSADAYTANELAAIAEWVEIQFERAQGSAAQ